ISIFFPYTTLFRSRSLHVRAVRGWPSTEGNAARAVGALRRRRSAHANRVSVPRLVHRSAPHFATSRPRRLLRVWRCQDLTPQWRGRRRRRRRRLLPPPYPSVHPYLAPSEGETSPFPVEAAKPVIRCAPHRVF